MYRLYKGAVAITPDNGNDLARTVDAISVSGAGNVRLVTINGDDVIYPMAAGQLLPVGVKKVFVTSTTATGIAGLIY
jgi:hypothetical protein